MVLGFVLIGAAAERLARRGVRPLAVAAGLTFGVCWWWRLLLLVPGLSVPWVLWPLFSFLATGSILGYAMVTQAFRRRWRAGPTPR